MKFSLTVDVDQVAGDPVDELGRVLRYWAGNLKHYELVPGLAQEVYDSAYTRVGEWAITE